MACIQTDTNITSYNLVWSLVNFLCVLMFSVHVAQESAGVNGFLSGSGDFVGKASSKVSSQHPKPRSELHTGQKDERTEVSKQCTHFVLHNTDTLALSVLLLGV